MTTSDFIFDSLIAVWILLKVWEIIKNKPLRMLQKQVDGQQIIISNLKDLYNDFIDATVIEKKQILDIVSKHEKKIIELEQQLHHGSSKI